MSGVIEQALTVEQRLERLRSELDALQRIKTQEDYDEGNRLHELHNAPWRKGPYSHMEFPTYKYREYPRMLYGLKYEAATLAVDEAYAMPAGSVDRDNIRKEAILRAEKAQRAQTKIIGSEAELRKLPADTWFLSPTEVVERLAADQRRLETAAGHRAYEDRNMSAKAKREIDAHDDAAEDFIAEIPRRRVAPKGKRVR